MVASGPKTDGQTQSFPNFQISLGDPKSPEEFFAADVAAFEMQADDVVVWFFQLGLNRLPYAALKLRYSFENFLRSIERDRPFFRLADEWLAKHRTGRERSVVDLAAWATLPGLQIVTERVTFERMVHSEGDAELEFFMLSPALMMDAYRRKVASEPTMAIRPVASISLSLGAFIDAFGEALGSDALEKKLRASMSTDV